MMHAPTLWTSQGGGGGGGVYPVEVVIDFAALDTQDFSAVPVGDVVTLSDGSAWVMSGSPFAFTSFGVVNGQGLVYSTLPGIVGFEPRALVRLTRDVHPTFASGQVRTEIQIASPSVFVPDVSHGLTVGWPKLPAWPMAPDLTLTPALYYTSAMVGGGGFGDRVRSLLGTVAGGWNWNQISLASYPGNRGLAPQQQLVLGMDTTSAGLGCTLRGVYWDTTSSPLAWPADDAIAYTGYMDLARAAAGGLPDTDGLALNSWLAPGVDQGPATSALTSLYMAATTLGQTCTIRAIRWRTL